MAAAVAANPAPAGEFEDGRALWREGRFAEALPLLEKAAAAAPGDADRLEGVATTLLSLARFAEAPRAFDAALAKEPAAVPLLLGRARAALLAMDQAAAEHQDPWIVYALLDGANRDLEAVLAKDPKSVSARALKARGLFSSPEGGGDAIAGFEKKQATALLEGALADAPGDAEANREMGHFLFHQAGADTKNKALWADSEKRFRAAFQARPDDGWSFLQATFAMAWQGASRRNLSDAYEKAFDLNPGEIGPLRKLVEMEKGLPAQLAVLDRLRGKRPGDSVVLSACAGTLLQAGRGKDAYAILKSAEEAAPADPWPAAIRGQLLLAEGKVPEGLAELQAAVGKGRAVFDRRLYQSVDFVAVRAEKGLAPGQRDALWTALFEAFPREADGPNNAGNWFRRNAKDGAKSAAWYARALTVRPDDPALLNDMGQVHEADLLNDAAKCESFYRSAVESAEKLGINDPDRCTGYKDAVDNLAKLLVRLKRGPDLLAYADQHLKKDPRYEGIRALARTAGK
jgi:tetratricopeptide (TPR) repeat protein